MPQTRVIWVYRKHSSKESNASVIQVFRKLFERDNPKEGKIQMPPSPSPAPSAHSFVHMSSGDDQACTDTDQRCEKMYNRCQDHKNMTACLTHDGSDITSEKIELLEHKAKKIDISANVGGSQSIVLSAGNGDCVIHMGSSAMIMGGTWACCKLGKTGRNLDGVPYQELEMGQPESLSAMNVETAEGWDQGWDDDWDEEKAVKSSNGNHVGNGQANGLASRASISGRGNDWDD
ncbi:hypothetical protein F0562_026384 [Nyssa sinensis]|uniref:DUF7356 domain-containing protein n=1 Tax=Nyssa sinensis TaxID=561372 RepID=A0A5J5BCR9_9ASTE|nr:hypothetical protein F0562_026384 [Nyssa sinensis]